MHLIITVIYSLKTNIYYSIVLFIGTLLILKKKLQKFLHLTFKLILGLNDNRILIITFLYLFIYFYYSKSFYIKVCFFTQIIYF